MDGYSMGGMFECQEEFSELVWVFILEFPSELKLQSAASYFEGFLVS